MACVSLPCAFSFHHSLMLMSSTKMLPRPRGGPWLRSWARLFMWFVQLAIVVSEQQGRSVNGSANAVPVQNPGEQMVIDGTGAIVAQQVDNQNAPSASLRGSTSPPGAAARGSSTTPQPPTPATLLDEIWAPSDKDFLTMTKHPFAPAKFASLPNKGPTLDELINEHDATCAELYDSFASYWKFVDASSRPFLVVMISVMASGFTFLLVVALLGRLVWRIRGKALQRRRRTAARQLVEDGLFHEQGIGDEAEHLLAADQAAPDIFAWIGEAEPL